MNECIGKAGQQDKSNFNRTLLRECSFLSLMYTLKMHQLLFFVVFDVVFVVVGCCVTIQFGTNPRLLFVEFFFTMFVYYTAHWQAFCSGTLRFGL